MSKVTVDRYLFESMVQYLETKVNADKEINPRFNYDHLETLAKEARAALEQKPSPSTEEWARNLADDIKLTKVKK